MAVRTRLVTVSFISLDFAIQVAARARAPLRSYGNVGRVTSNRMRLANSA